MKKLASLFLAAVLLTGCAGATGNETSPGTKTPASVTAAEKIPEGLKTSTEGQFDWYNATVYYAMTDRFLNGDPANDKSYGRMPVDAKGSRLATFNGGDFTGLAQKIEEGYFTDLGINAIWMSAPYEQIHGFVSGGDKGEYAHYGFHGYYPLDWTMTDRNFGTRDEFEALVDAAHARGIRIVLDVVMNHAGYYTLRDMGDYGFGSLSGFSSTWLPEADQRYDAYQEGLDFSDEAAWAKWWGPEWVRSALPGYESGGSDDRTMTLAGLPDIRTEAEGPVAIPPLLKTKWAQEAGEEYAPWRLKKASGLRQDLELSPAGYITAWLSAWVEEFGIDGFRIDTAKHVEPERWTDLKKTAQTALETWRSENPEKPGADFTDDFFMIGEVWGMGIQDSEYYDYGFDALINFTFQGERGDGPAYRMETMPAQFRKYDDALSGKEHTVLTYLSSHDTRLFQRKKLKDGLTYLMLLPGALEIFYGDESGRNFVSSGSDAAMGTRSYMNWDSPDEEILAHFAGLGGFRARNLSVGAGSHTELSKEPFIFMREYRKNGLENRVLVAFDQTPGTPLDVSEAFQDGDLIRDANTMLGYRVVEGKVTPQEVRDGVLLLEKLD